MSTWQERLQVEFEELTNRISKLTTFIRNYSQGELHFTPSCSLELLTMQLNAMVTYHQILAVRLNIELKDNKED